MLASALSIDAVTKENAAELASVRALWREYADYLIATVGPDHICMQDFNKELQHLPGEHSPPHGALLLAVLAKRPVGCTALRPIHLPDGTRAGEIRRMWVRQGYRGKGIGRALLQAAFDSARHAAYEAVYLDTVPEKMPEAERLYRLAGFVECPRYNKNAISGIAFFRKTLFDEA